MKYGKGANPSWACSFLGWKGKILGRRMELLLSDGCKIMKRGSGEYICIGKFELMIPFLF